ncbi:hypothetical protein PF005_g5256 [Phytophthora fragariae]|uniref:Uncharacterized protein n=2 Tax=Phytophthora TaxID=4783 RepID=A0A6A3TJN9_9STRA|nr:hypothetical protein PF003_g35026 [Phytophthora fragariae]KAE8966921.1 hypothetical protein PR002_g28220 [Phytophthora rubi]KAE8944633.1 hypothetical protein PF009_g5693 [Phytophthora fragariae]KAE9006884.1 hypothetical protein PF011_g11387 [Phytophthora fragariae]KAE9128496.1 hypothetical protein PF010_g4499 [Phytophthora fragariae]
MPVLETSPDTGTYWKHHAVRLASVAQHSFHHVEKHLNSNRGGEELVDKRQGQFEKIMSSTKGKRGTLEHECKLMGMTERHNKRYTLDQLKEMNLGDLAEAEDIR